jgi:hypothetical protein
MCIFLLCKLNKNPSGVGAVAETAQQDEENRLRKSISLRRQPALLLLSFCDNF